MECHVESQNFCTSLRMSSVRVEPNVIDDIVCPSFLLLIITGLCVQLPIQMNDRGTSVLKGQP